MAGVLPQLSIEIHRSARGFVTVITDLKGQDLRETPGAATNGSPQLGKNIGLSEPRIEMINKHPCFIIFPKRQFDGFRAIWVCPISKHTHIMGC